MGWLYTCKPRGLPIKDFFQERFGEGVEILDCAAKFDAAYMAVRNVREPEKVYGVVCLIRHVPKDHYNFGYKDMDESCGPNVSECPERILDLLSPVEDLYPHPQSRQWAREWRERCRACIERRKSVKKGVRVRFSRPIHFQSGLGPFDTFVFEGRTTFREASTGLRVRIRNWQARELEVIDA